MNRGYDMTDIVKSREEWEIEFVAKLRSSTRLKTDYSILLEMYNSQNRTAFQEKQLQNILDAEYKKYKIDIDFQNLKAKADEKTKSAFLKLQEHQKRENALKRKERAAELIKIGALFDLVDFPKDRGIVTGALLMVKKMIMEDGSLTEKIKADGDRLLHSREIEKKGLNHE
jgi:hypothetical protein